MAIIVRGKDKDGKISGQRFKVGKEELPEERVRRIDKDLDTSKNKLIEVSSELEDQSEETEILMGAVIEVYENLEDITGVLNEAIGNIEENEKSVSTLQTKLKNLKDKTLDLEEKAEKIEGKIDQVEEKLNKVDELSESMLELKDTAEKNKDKIDKKVNTEDLKDIVLNILKESKKDDEE